MKLNVMILDEGAYGDLEHIEKKTREAEVVGRILDPETEIHDYTAEFVEELHEPGSKGNTDLSIHGFSIEFDDDFEKFIKALLVLNEYADDNIGFAFRRIIEASFREGRKHALKHG